MNTGHKNSCGPRWRELYQAAVFETDRSKLAARIEEAQSAMVQRVRELYQDGENIQERQAVDAAICTLQVLRDMTASAGGAKRVQRPAAKAAQAA